MSCDRSRRTIAIASGKGGTGKTTVAVNLAVAASHRGAVQLLDCDVEAPNCHIFLRPEITTQRGVAVEAPQLHEEKCTACGECSRFCAYNALALLHNQLLIFPELCHACGGCMLVCPTGAIAAAERTVGTLLCGEARGIGFCQGRLRVGEGQSPPLIRAVREAADGAAWTFIDAPPGTSCPVIASVRGSDYVCLVTEPTPFGLNDLILAAQMTRALGLPMGVVINRSDIGDDRVRTWCAREGVALLAEIRFDRRIAEAYARGEIVSEAVPETAPMFASLLDALERETTR